MFQPRLLLGVVLIGLGVFSYVFNPSWQTPLGIIVLIAVGILGGVAIAFDLRMLWQDVKKMAAQDKRDDVNNKKAG